MHTQTERKSKKKKKKKHERERYLKSTRKSSHVSVWFSVQEMAGGAGKSWVNALKCYADNHNLTVLYNVTSVPRGKNLSIFECKAELCAPGSTESFAVGQGYGSQQSVAESFAAEALLSSLQVLGNEGKSKFIAERTANPNKEVQVREVSVF